MSEDQKDAASGLGSTIFKLGMNRYPFNIVFFMCLYEKDRDAYYEWFMFDMLKNLGVCGDNKRNMDLWYAIR